MTTRPTPDPGPGRPAWWIFHGTGRPLPPAERDRRWPAPPPWRDFDGGPDLPPPPDDEREASRRLGSVATGQLSYSQLSVINAAICLRRPLLVTGGPGSGKSTLAYLIARELGLGRVLRWPVTSRTTVRSGLYEYDAIGRAQAVVESGGGGATAGPGRAQRPVPPIGDFVHLGPLGTALLPYRHPRVLLVDELDKSDYDLPNDLLTIFEDGEFDLPELVRVRNLEPDMSVYTADRGATATVRGGIVRVHEFPIIVITSNGEREFPAAFLRRCIRLDVPDPDADALADLVLAHFPRGAVDDQRRIVEEFVARRRHGMLAADQLLNAAHLVTSGAFDGDGQERAELLAAVWRRLDPTSNPG
ncbi:AAA family ATPase [Frankia sp. CNm7]|uniref:AAA family ATPase n=1 Tax=Frankia nepalensis TaxID=1836974 RepID=A0A937RGN5_9ACTN|nr:AAA family ATPase [Frankia nepalensis]MBL7497788.1 AAA family ATPase [Frankia nepalensis]MBL7511291.1 AAA family ATPase [Frankia nepalensis]MBL7517688.1 AAA family ATPase [Frankia nepalensis]MBL7629857.1 AAA family ATPase [Frankia nepalensis]